MMEETAAEFTLFSRLPAELRFKIWESVRRPTRVIGILPPAARWYRHHYRAIGTRTSAVVEEKDPLQRYNYRYIVQPKKHAIFPLLHACREARDLWKPHFFQPSRLYHASNITIRFDTPFISYDTDIFAVFDGWPPNGIPSDVFLDPRLADNGDQSLDGFIALDRSRIRNLALCEIPGDLTGFANAISIRQLPNLQTLTIMALGPDEKRKPESLASEGSGGDIAYSLPVLEMLAVDVQRIAADIHDIPPELVLNSPFLTDARLRHPIALSPSIRPLIRYKTFVLSLLWHELREPNAVGAITESWWEYTEYLFSNRMDDDEECPLNLPGCGVHGHTKRELLEWAPKFEVNYKLLCATEWRDELKNIGIVKP
ncbi:hypothetical protein CI102_9621 [Trichoderma harzianum]|nr:hypothetical protein CI102_9621 [Trichoderma harzianum]